MFRILLVDDEPMVTKGLERKIPWHDMNCVVTGIADDGEKALQMAERESPHIVICDIRMPRLSGLEFIKALKEVDPNCQIIILSGYRDFEYARKAIHLGVLRYLLKPSRLNEIQEAVELAISQLKEMDDNKEQFNALLNQLRRKEGTDASVPLHPLVLQTRDFLRRNFKSDLDLGTVAEELEVSTWHLSKTVKKELNISFVDLINGIRTDEACTLLESSTLKVYEIAEEVGFRDVAYFSKVFKKQTGSTPNQYRKQNYDTLSHRKLEKNRMKKIDNTKN